MKNRILSTQALSTDLAALLLRLIFGGLFVYHGYDKIIHYDTDLPMMKDILGIGAKLSYNLLIFSEFCCGIFVTIGLLTRLAVLPIAFSIGVAFFIAHAKDAFMMKELPFTFMFLYEPAIGKKEEKKKNMNIKAPRIIWMLFVNIMLMWLIFFLIPVQIPFHLKAIGVEKNSLVGAAIAMSTAFSALSSFSYSKIKGKLSFLFVFSIGYFLLAIGFACVSVSNTYTVVVAGMILSGLGVGMMIPNTNMWVMKITPPQIRGREIGKLTTFWFLGQFLSPIIIFPVLKILSLSSTFMVAAGVLLLISIGFLIFHFSTAMIPE